MSLAIEQKVCQTLETSKPTIIYKLLHSVTLSIWFQQNSHRCCLPIKRPFMHGRTCVKNTEWESLVLPNCHMHKLRHGGFNTREGKKGHCCAARDEVGWHAVNSIIKPVLWSHREWRNDIYHKKKRLLPYFRSLPDRWDGFMTNQRAGLHVHSMHPLRWLHGTWKDRDKRLQSSVEIKFSKKYQHFCEGREMCFNSLEGSSAHHYTTIPTARRLGQNCCSL